MNDPAVAELLAAYSAACAALDQLRQALVAAGVAIEPAPMPTPVEAPESPDDRRRRLARERSRRARARHALSVTERDGCVTASRSSVTESVTERDAVTPKRDASVTKRDGKRDAASRARAFLIEEDLNTSPLFATQTPHPHAEQRDAGGVTAEPAPIASEATPKGGAGKSRRPGGRRERPALAPGSTIGVSDGSPAVPASDRAPAGAGFDPASDVGRVWSAYLESIAPTRARLTATREALVVRRLREYSVDELTRAVRGYGRSAFHRGENDRGQKYQAIELWLRDAAHVEAGWSYLDAPAPGPKAKAKKGAPELDGIGAEWEEYAARLELERDVFAEA